MVGLLEIYGDIIGLLETGRHHVIIRHHKATYHNLWPDLKLSTNHPSVDAMAPTLRKVLFDVDKARIEDRIVSMLHGAISRSLSIPRRTVSNFIARLKNRGTRANLNTLDGHE